MQYLIDPTGDSLPLGKHDVRAAIAENGCVYIESFERTIVVTVNAELLTPLAAVAAGYRIGELRPAWTLIVQGLEWSERWLYENYPEAILKMIDLARRVDSSDQHDGVRDRECEHPADDQGRVPELFADN
jgi:hypothetical protein